MAEINKLSVGKVLDKLRGTDPPASKMARLDEKIAALNEETQRSRALRLRVEQDQRASSTGRVAQEGNTARSTKLKITGIIIGMLIVIPVAMWTFWLLWP
jgi:hypothetical protein